MKYTAIVEHGENGWLVGQIREIPAAIAQGENFEELKRNLLDALHLILDLNEKLSEKDFSFLF
jgi:predicted RNase H-like HicB family nuclease